MKIAQNRFRVRRVKIGRGKMRRKKRGETRCGKDGNKWQKRRKRVHWKMQITRMENKRERMTTTRRTTTTTKKTTRVRGVFGRVGRVGGKIKSLSRGKRLIDNRRLESSWWHSEAHEAYSERAHTSTHDERAMKDQEIKAKSLPAIRPSLQVHGRKIML